MELDVSELSVPVFEALASKTRVNIIRFIGSNQKSISDIANHMNLSNAIVSRHVQQMEDVGILTSKRGKGKNRNKKIVSLKIDIITILFPEKIYQSYLLHTTDVKIGHFTDFNVEPTCGLATCHDIVGQPDNPKYFFVSERVEASLLWFRNGFVEYKIPNMLEANEKPELLEISFEIASEFPGSNNVWPSDISIFINDLRVAIYTVPGNFSDVRGRYTPEWWGDNFSQYGQLKHIRITNQDTGIDGKKYSEINIDDLNLKKNPFIKLRFEIEIDSKNQGGLTLFGDCFGNHNQNILVNTYYLPQN